MIKYSTMVGRTLSLFQNKYNGGSEMEKLRLVRPEKKHEKQAIEYLKEFDADGTKVHGAGGLDRYKDDYDGWLEKLAADRVQEPNDERVPAETFFLVKQQITPTDGSEVVCDGHHGGGAAYLHLTERIVGMVNIRLDMNDILWIYGGHIGYSIRPSERRKGYNKVNLYLALKVCQNHGLEAVLLDCDKSNIGSAKTMRALGGKLIRECPHKNWEDKDTVMQWYVIDVDAALAKYASQYDPFVSEYPE